MPQKKKTNSKTKKSQTKKSKVEAQQDTKSAAETIAQDILQSIKEKDRAKICELIERAGKEISAQQGNETLTKALEEAILNAAADSGDVKLEVFKALYVNGLLEKNSDILSTAITSGNFEAVKFLAKIFDLSAESARSETLSPLLWALSRGSEEMVRVLLENGANPNSQELDQNGSVSSSALSRAISAGRVDCCKELIAYGAKLSLQNKFGTTPLLQAVTLHNSRLLQDAEFAKFNIEIIEHILDHPDIEKFINIEDNNGLTPLEVAIDNNQDWIVKKLLEKGAKISDRIITKLQKLITLPNSLQSDLKYRNILLAALDHIEDISIFEQKGLTSPVTAAAAAGDIALLEKLIAKGFNINSQHSALFQPEESENPDDENAEVSTDCAALYFAIYFQKSESVEFLLENGVQFPSKIINEIAKSDDSFLINVVSTITKKSALTKKTIEESLQKLIEYGADINYKEEDGKQNSALHFAIEGQKDLLIESLLNCGADTNLKNIHGVDAVALTSFNKLNPKTTKRIISQCEDLDKKYPRVSVRIIIDEDKDEEFLDSEPVTLENYSALELAVNAHNKVAMIALLAAGANMDFSPDEIPQRTSAPDEDQKEDLKNLAKDFLLLQQLMKKEIGIDDLREKSFNLDTVIAQIFKTADIQFIENLIDTLGANFTEESSGQPLMMYAIAERRLDLLNLFLEKGADVNRKFSYNQSFLKDSCIRDHKASFSKESFDLKGLLEVVEKTKICDETASLSHCLFLIQNTSGLATKDIIEVIKALIENGADIFEKDQEGFSAIEKILRIGSSELTKFVIEKFKNLEKLRYKDGNTIIHLAALSGNRELFRILLKSNPDLVNASNDQGKTVLDLIAENPKAKDDGILDKSLILTALFYGAELSILQPYYEKLLALKEPENRVRVKEELIEKYGKKLGVVLFDTIIYVTKYRNPSFEFRDLTISIPANVVNSNLNIELKKDILQDLKDRGFGINQEDYKGTSPIHWSIYRKEEEIFNKLVELGANLNYVREKSGYSVLMQSVAISGMETITKKILEDPGFIKNTENITDAIKSSIVNLNYEGFVTLINSGEKIDLDMTKSIISTVNGRLNILHENLNYLQKTIDLEVEKFQKNTSYSILTEEFDDSKKEKILSKIASTLDSISPSSRANIVEQIITNFPNKTKSGTIAGVIGSISNVEELEFFLRLAEKTTRENLANFAKILEQFLVSFEVENLEEIGRSHFTAIEKLLQAYEFPQKLLADGSTFLHKFAETSNVKAIEKFIEKGADLNAADIDGKQPLHEEFLDEKTKSRIVSLYKKTKAEKFGTLKLPLTKKAREKQLKALEKEITQEVEAKKAKEKKEELKRAAAERELFKSWEEKPKKKAAKKDKAQAESEAKEDRESAAKQKLEKEKREAEAKKALEERRKAEEEAKKKKEQELKIKQELEKRQKESEAKEKAEEAARRAADKKKAEARAQKKAEKRKKIEAQARQKEIQALKEEFAQDSYANIEEEILGDLLTEIAQEEKSLQTAAQQSTETIINEVISEELKKPLQQAILENKKEIFQKLATLIKEKKTAELLEIINKNPESLYYKNFGQNLLHICAIEQNLEAAQILLKKDREEKLQYDDNLDTKYQAPIHIALLKKDFKMAELLIDNGANLDDLEKTLRFCKESATNYLFNKSIKIHDKRLAAYLLDKVALNINHLETAFRSENLEMMQYIIANGFDPNSLWYEGGHSLLFDSVAFEDVAILNELLKHQHHLINFQTEIGETVLHNAVLKGNYLAVDMLLKSGANPFLTDKDGLNAFDTIAKAKSFEAKEDKLKKTSEILSDFLNQNTLLYHNILTQNKEGTEFYLRLYKQIDKKEDAERIMAKMLLSGDQQIEASLINMMQEFKIPKENIQASMEEIIAEKKCVLDKVFEATKPKESPREISAEKVANVKAQERQ